MVMLHLLRIRVLTAMSMASIALAPTVLLAQTNNCIQSDMATGATPSQTKCVTPILPTQSGAEDSLIELQTTMASRAAVTQITTPMIRANNESTRTIIDNIGR